MKKSVALNQHPVSPSLSAMTSSPNWWSSTQAVLAQLLIATSIFAGVMTVPGGFAAAQSPAQPPGSSVLRLASPDQLKAKAAQSRQHLREVLLDLQQNTGELRDPQTFDRYFFILDELQSLAVRFQLQNIYPNGVEQTGLKMVAHGIRWLDVSQRSSADIQYYLKYADADITGRWLAESDLLARNTRLTEARLRHMATQLETLIPWIEQRYPQRRDLQVSTREIVSTIAIRFLLSPAVSQDNQMATFWINKISLPSSYAEYLDNLSNNILSIPLNQHQQLTSMSRRLLALGQKLARETYPLPSYLLSAWGHSAVDLLLRSVQAERVFEPQEFESYLALLRNQSLQSLSTQWLSSERIPTGAYASNYLSLSAQLIRRLRQAGLAREAGELSQAASKLAAPLHGRAMGLEGYYLLQAQDGTEFEFSVVYARNNLVYAALGLTNGYATKAFFNVTFDVERQKFVASEREADLDASANPTITFSINRQGEIEIEDLFSQPKWQNLRGRRTANYLPLLDQELQQQSSTEGVYEGEFTFKDGNVWKVQLLVSRVGGATFGRLSGPSGVRIDFQTGNTGQNGVIYLTTGRLPQTSWIQIRGKLQGDHLEGQMISGARGLTVPSFKLKRVR